MINYFREENAWLSNMTSVPILYKGHTFNSTEAAFMWEKDPNGTVETPEGVIPWLQFCLTQPPNIVKKKSREVKLREDWNDVKLKIMYDVLVIKFSQPYFMTKLLATENQNIVEGNFWNDRFWGVDVKVTPNEGENWLGRLIMDIRNKIQKGRL